ncbi:hypothetical protein QAD02_022862 [Eretmocerus hayati]|uniref:Uncharacterized protein n=1 Tax=Eretmocerus hayati TaxID=131215 RepID=A0ACC2PUA6_9HYME|nr:hypothetical protein QAD02_022862 [Eretmocerus hayati]
MTIFLLFLLLALVIIYVRIKFNRGARIISRVPGPPCIPILGNALCFNCSAEKAWDNVLKFLDQYYPIFRLQFAHIYGVFVRHPDDLKVIFSCRKNIKKCHLVYDNFKYEGHDGLIFSDGDKWHQRRKMLNLAFSTNLIRGYTQIAINHADHLIENLKSQGDENVQNLLPLFNGLTLRVVCETILGVNLTLKPEDEETYRHALDEISETVFYRAQRPYITDWMTKFLKIGRKMKNAINTTNAIADKIITERRKYLELTHVSDQDFVDDANDTANLRKDTGNKERSAVLDSLLMAEREGLINAEGIRDEVNTIIAAGYETTGTSISFTLLLFAENKEAQDRARAEVFDIIDQNGGLLTYAEIQKMDYLERCVKESLRLFPSAPLIGRSLIQDIQLKNHLIPIGSEVCINFYSLHRDPNFWPEPSKFDPDRFLPEAVQNRHSHAYLPFSAGLRDCIGRKFAMLEVKAALARILRNFYIEPVDLISNIKFEVGVTLRPTKPVHVKFVRIDKK